MSCLVILAAGLGSRFGGAKQLVEFGPLKRTLMEYNICHAYEQGFSKIVLIIQPQSRTIIEKQIVPRLPCDLEVCLAEQNNTDLPKNCLVLESFNKPLGTAHALWCARSFLTSHFSVINGDDYYSEDALKLLASSAKREQSIIVAFRLDKTLSEFGGVNRGICKISKHFDSESSSLVAVQECLDIKREQAEIKGYLSTLTNKQKANNLLALNKKLDLNKVLDLNEQLDSNQQLEPTILTGQELVSMNCWGFKQSFIQRIEQFLVKHFGQSQHSPECYLPDVVMHSINNKLDKFLVERTDQNWFGLTHPEDSSLVETNISKLSAVGMFHTLTNKMIELQKDNRFESILPQYGYPPKSCKIYKIGNGLINCTYKVISHDKSFILQKINHHVFSKPKQVIDNANKINQHLLEQQKQNNYPLQLIPQINNNDSTESYVCYQALGSTEVETWRALRMITNTKTIESVNSISLAEKVAEAFAIFSKSLNSFDANSLNIVIPNFHNLKIRLKQLKIATKQDKIGRKESVKHLINFCFEQNNFVADIADFSQKLPVRVTHNDTKISNLLFDSKGLNPVAVIDLDTCMPGFLMNDFGDMVRTCCSNLAEDAIDLENMHIRTDIFAALAKGYIQSIGEELTDLERRSLILGAQLLPFICGVRFLTDYLNGDVYFSIKHQQHNQQRAANQLHFYALLAQSKEELSEYILNIN
jgi:choline kinase